MNSERLKKIYKIVNALGLRERILIFVILLLAIFLFWYFVFWESLSLQRTNTALKIQTVKKETELLEIQIKNLKAKKEKKGDVKQNFTSCESNLATQEMTKILNDLVEKQSNITLLELKSLPATAIETAGFYKHGISMKVTGDFFSLLNYLKDIEKLKWCLFWDRLDYKVINYPKAEINLDLHTISDKDGWLYL